MSAIHETHARSAVKAITYRIAIMVTDASAVYFLTSRADYALGVMAITGVINTLLYIGHERVWNHIHWGRAFVRRQLRKKRENLI